MTRSRRHPVLRGAQLLLGCVVLGVGVTLALVPRLGSDGYSTLVNGLSIGLDVSFLWMSVVVGLAFVGLGWVRGVRPGIGTITQVAVVSLVVNLGLEVVDQPDALWARLVLLVAAFPVLAAGIALYLGVGLGAGPVEAAALGFDPPVPFAVSYNTAQLLGALVGWWQGAAVGLGTIVVIVLLGPAVALAARLLRQDLHQPGTRAAEAAEAASA
ncbi:YczE/YyaS/YitT family protein [Nocardioides marmoribigeumensis]|uniref:Membrane protein YczE n=1 Tax=Nocardioides marmoribigeumensis TaxID=433649 RepID=A0ABU2BZL4_9ACTN|nr:hypothetical protein [Nocardioides marmoribigeumensis]MDR7363845.1 putative membrane protein YczE [Nocardioides marmoribigeumensis]